MLPSNREGHSAREVRRRIREVGANLRFHVFISYSHDFDSTLASQLRRRLQTVSRRWWERRRVRVFLDTAEVTAGGSLPTQIHDNLVGPRGEVGANPVGRLVRTRHPLICAE